MNFSPSFKFWPLHLIRVAVTATVLWLVVNEMGFNRIVAHLGHIDVCWLAVAAIITMLQIVLLTLRWMTLHEKITGEVLPFGTFFVATGRSLLLGQLLPATVGIDAVRVVVLTRKTSIVSVLRSVACDRLVGLAALIFIVAVIFPFFAALVANRPAVTSVALITLFGTASFAVLVVFPGIASRLPFVGKYVTMVGSDLQSVVRLRVGALTIFLLSVVCQLMAVLVFIALANALGSMMPARLAAVIVPPALLIATAPISLGGWGVREASIATAFLLVSGDPVIGTMASILYGLTSPLGGAAAELIALARSVVKKATDQPMQGSA
jgi:glycosyltransferase 2 family protein